MLFGLPCGEVDFPWPDLIAAQRAIGQHFPQPPHQPFCMSELEIQWPPPPPSWNLGAAEVHVWTAELDRDAAEIAAFAKTLSPDEQARAARSTSTTIRTALSSGAASLRRALGATSSRPESLRFGYSEHGKPTLAAPTGERTLHFTWRIPTKSLWLAVTYVCAVGVDVEKIRPVRNFHGIAERFFSAREIAALKNLPPADQPAGFFNLWTRKRSLAESHRRRHLRRTRPSGGFPGTGRTRRLLRLFGDEPAPRVGPCAN